MTQFEAFKGFYLGELALVLAPDTIVWVVDPLNRVFVVEQHGQVIDQGRLSPLQAKRFTEAASGAREITRTTINLNRLARGASA